MSQFFRVSKNIRDKRGGGWLGITIFRQEFFVSVPKNYVSEPFNLSLFSGIEIFYMLERVMSRFSVEFFRLAVPNYFVAETFCAVFQNFWWRKSLWNRRGGGGEYQDFPSNSFRLTVPKYFVEKLLCFRNFRV